MNITPEISFIMPTINRRQWVGRAIDSCLQVPKSEVIVLDGGSKDGSFEFITKRYQRNPRVRIKDMTGDACMERWITGVELARADYATFMFDDDVLSPFWHRVLKAAQGVGFACGLGECGPVEKVMGFKQPTAPEFHSHQNLLSHYASGDYQFAPRRGLPVSPICSVHSTSALHRWSSEMNDFYLENGTPMRKRFGLELNAGPDLMVYLVSLSGPVSVRVPILNSIVAQFSAHPDSISCQMDPLDLALAYWLPLVWLDQYLRQLWRIEEANYYRTFTVKHGWDLFNRRAAAGKHEWQSEFAAEIEMLGV